jgi:hypothetical protein
MLVDEHLQTCERCRALLAAWQETQLELRVVQWATPREGFAQRWREHYRRQTVLAQQRRALAVFLFTSLMATLLAFPFFALIASPAQPLWLRVVIALYNLSALLPAMEGISTFLVTVSRTIAQFLTPSLEFALSLAFGAVLVVWLAMLRKFSFGRLRTR